MAALILYVVLSAFGGALASAAGRPEAPPQPFPGALHPASLHHGAACGSPSLAAATSVLHLLGADAPAAVASASAASGVEDSLGSAAASRLILAEPHLSEGRGAAGATDEGVEAQGHQAVVALQKAWGHWRSKARDPKEDYINRMDCLILGSVLASTAAGAVAGASFTSRDVKEGSTPLWVLSLLASSYLLLIPGLSAIVLSFDVQATFGGNVLDITGVQSEAMFPLAKLLFESGSHSGGVAIILFAVIIPGIKLILLAIGEFWRFSPDANCVQTARTCIQVVQLISKWACPDMFAYILLLYLFRDLDERSPLIGIPTHLEVGFSCFSLFCVSSTLATLALRLPGEPRDTASTETQPWALRFFGREGIFAAAASLGLAFAGLLALGMVLPCLAMRLDENMLVEPNGPLPAAFKPVLERLEIGKQVNADVSMWGCLKALLRWLHHGELNCIFAFSMIGVFAIGLTVVDMGVLLTSAALFRAEARKEKEVAVGDFMAGGPRGALGRNPWSRRVLAMSRVLKHASMLDVAVVGIQIVALAGAAYRDNGFVLSNKPGLYVLGLADVLHYIMYYTVLPAVEYEAPFAASHPCMPDATPSES